MKVIGRRLCDVIFAHLLLACLCALRPIAVKCVPIPRLLWRKTRLRTTDKQA